jgi:PqqD family protein of HPr-rel-A system
VRLEAVDGLLIRRFDDEAIVFDSLSWDAHLLNPAAVAVLELILDAPKSETEIAEFLKTVLVQEEQSHAAAHARRLIGELQSLGLIRRTEASPSASR